MEKEFTFKVKIEYNPSKVRIVNSYLIKDKLLMKYILEKFVKETNYKSKRSIKNWVKEWKAHTLLYRLGLFRSHTKDCDLEENEAFHRLVAYEFLSLF